MHATAVTADSLMHFSAHPAMDRPPHRSCTQESAMLEQRGRQAVTTRSGHWLALHPEQLADPGPQSEQFEDLVAAGSSDRIRTSPNTEVTLCSWALGRLLMLWRRSPALSLLMTTSMRQTRSRAAVNIVSLGGGEEQ